MKVIILLTAIVIVSGQNNSLPDGFLLGFASNSISVEGAWNLSGKGESIWDRFIHTHPELVDGHSADVAADQYHHYLADAQLMKQIGTQLHRFSLSWPRILPEGTDNKINQEGIDYYNNFINALLENEIVPMVTLYHWDLPQRLQDLGGWPNPIMADYYEDYVRVAFSAFGDRVKHWITFNEPLQICADGYGNGAAPPLIHDHGVADYLCGHTLLQAHARAYHLYNDTFRPEQNGMVGITLSGDWVQPNSTSEEDKTASETAMDFQIGWFAHPIFTKAGDYPPIMRKYIDENSALEGRPRSRLPVFDNDIITKIRGTADFFGLNQYTSSLAVPAITPVGEDPSWNRDQRVLTFPDPTWDTGAVSWLYIVPWGIRNLLRHIKDTYNDPIIYITENGYCDNEELEDDRRINFHYSYIQEVLNAIYEDSVKVKGYTAWTLLDGFTMHDGIAWGIISVNMTDPERPRTLKKSASWYKQVLETRTLVKPTQFFENENEY